MNADTNPWIGVALAVSCFAACVLLAPLIVRLLGKMGGWAPLASVYSAKAPVSGDVWTWQSAWIGGDGCYSMTLIVTLNDHGMGLACGSPFGHPPLFLPWQDASSRRGFGIFTRPIILTFAKAPQNTVTLFGRIADSVDDLLCRRTAEIDDLIREGEKAANVGDVISHAAFERQVKEWRASKS